MPTFAEYFAGTMNVSVESLLSGEVEREIEFTMYVYLDDLAELAKKSISSEKHEQWLIPLAKEECNVKQRIRLIDGVRPTQAIKTKIKNEMGVEEVEFDITMDAFKALRGAAVDGYLKTRYCVPSTIRGLIWEVDVFYTNGGAQSPWVKVDLEVKSLADPIPQFPLSFKKVIYADEELTYTDRATVKSLWETEWQKIDTKKY